MRNELAIVFNKENCIQCLGCETACKTWRKLELGLRWRRIINVWDGDYPDVKCGALSVSCQHCAAPACIKVCPVEAISKRQNDGAVLVDGNICIGCRACLEACPFGIPQFGADGLMQKCDMCRALRPDDDFNQSYIPPCVRTCPTEALELKMLTVDEKKENEAALVTEIKKSGAPWRR